MSAVRNRDQVPYNAKIAQSVEHRIENPGVGGSIPSLGTSNGSGLNSLCWRANIGSGLNSLEVVEKVLCT